MERADYSASMAVSPFWSNQRYALTASEAMKYRRRVTVSEAPDLADITINHAEAGSA